MSSGVFDLERDLDRDLGDLERDLGDLESDLGDLERDLTGLWLWLLLPPPLPVSSFFFFSCLLMVMRSFLSAPGKSSPLRAGPAAAVRLEFSRRRRAFSAPSCVSVRAVWMEEGRERETAQRCVS